MNAIFEEDQLLIGSIRKVYERQLESSTMSAPHQRFAVMLEAFAYCRDYEGQHGPSDYATFKVLCIA